jgi:hypothetical protein
MVGRLSGGGRAGDAAPKAHDLEASVALLRRESEIAPALLALSVTLAPLRITGETRSAAVEIVPQLFGGATARRHSLLRASTKRSLCSRLVAAT